MRSFLALPALLLAAAPVAAQRSVVVEQVLKVPMGSIGTAIELRDGRVAFVDADLKRRVFGYANFTTGKVDTIRGRTDSTGMVANGGQYKLPGMLARFRGDTVAMVDFMTVRTLLFSDQGKFYRQLPIPELGNQAPLTWYDTLGNGYKVDYSPLMGGAPPGAALLRDSLRILRVNFATEKIDIVGKISMPELGDAVIGAQMQQVAKIFSPNDLWGVFPDGTLWILRGKDARLDLRDPKGRWYKGPPRNIPRLKVTQADKDAVIARLQARGLPALVRFPFADTKPAMEHALSWPGVNEIWSLRSRPDEKSPSVWDTMTRDGVSRGTVSFPAGTVLVGFGGGNRVYVAQRQGTGDVYYLARAVVK